MSGTKLTVKERCSDVQFQPPTTCDVMFFFKLRGLITKSCGVTLPVTEMMATRRLQTRTIFRQPASVCLYFFGNLFSGPSVPLYLVANLFVFVLDRCTWFEIFDSVFSVLYPRECHLKIQTLRSPFTCKRHTRNYPRRHATHTDVYGSKTLTFAPSMARSAPFG